MAMLVGRWGWQRAGHSFLRSRLSPRYLSSAVAHQGASVSLAANGTAVALNHDISNSIGTIQAKTQPAVNPTLPMRVPPPKRASARRRINAATESGETPIHTVIAVCTAVSYDFRSLCAFLEGTFPQIQRLEDVIRVQLVAEPSKCASIEAFFFQDGCFVIWGPPTDASTFVLRLKDVVKPFEMGSLRESETETLFCKTRPTEHFYAGMEGETIVLETPERENSSQSSIQAKLAFSNGLIDSVKLAVLENSLEDFIEKVKPIPMMLAQGGKLPLSRAQVLRFAGELLRFRADLNLHSELTDTPEVYWSEPLLEELYERTSRVLEIRQRGRVLNRRLDYANELVSVLRSHLSEEHGLKLEWGIIMLIAVEVAFETLHWIVQIVRN